MKKPILIILLMLSVLLLASCGKSTPVPTPATGGEETPTSEFGYVIVGDITLDPIDTEFYYNSSIQEFASQYGDYLSSFGLDLSKPLDEQPYPADENKSWKEYFKEQSIVLMQNDVAQAEEAKKSGVVLTAADEEHLLSIEQQMLDQFGGDEAALLENMRENLGQNMTVERFRGYMERAMLASSWYESVQGGLSFTEQELRDFFNGNEEYNFEDYNYKLVNIRHILISDEAEANALFDEWRKNPTEDHFAALASEKTEDGGSKATGGLYSGVYKNQMVQTFNDWCFNPGRLAGDSGIVQSDYGYHLMYLSGFGDEYWKKFAQEKLASEAYNEKLTELLKKYPVES